MANLSTPAIVTHKRHMYGENKPQYKYPLFTNVCGTALTRTPWAEGWGGGGGGLIHATLSRKHTSHSLSCSTVTRERMTALTEILFYITHQTTI